MCHLFQESTQAVLCVQLVGICGVQEGNCSGLTMWAVLSLGRNEEGRRDNGGVPGSQHNLVLQPRI